MYEQLRHALEENGELMILTDSGEEHELHLHNVSFEDDNMIKVDAATKIYWLHADKIERYWIHKDF